MLWRRYRHRSPRGVIQTVREKFTCRDCERISQPPAPFHGDTTRLSNIFLHHVLDEWFEREAKPRLRGSCQLVRFADDCVLLSVKG